MSYVGMNLSSVNYYGTETPFLDRFKTSREWQASDPTGGKIDDRTVATDAAGNPLGIPKGSPNITTLFAIDPVGLEMTDRYVVTYDGTAKITFGGAKIVSSEKGRMIIEAVGDNRINVQMVVKEISAADPLRNISVVREDQEALLKAGQIFNPAFLEKTSNWDVIRFMDWGDTNRSAEANWADRGLITDATWASAAHDGGVPLEVMIRLANEAKTDMWYNVPTMANDAYVKNALTLIRDTLDPSLKVHVEWSNEVWNNSFDVAQYAYEKGTQLFGKDVNGDGKIDASDPKEAVSGAKMLYYGYRSAQVAAIGKSVFTGGNADRLETVLGGQASYASLTNSAIKGAEAAKVGTIGHLFSEYAITTYFGNDIGSKNAADQATVLGWARSGEAGLKAAFKQLETGGLLTGTDFSLKAVMGFLNKQADIAEKYGMDLVAYEGGAHIAASNFPDAQQAEVMAFVARLMDDPRMGALYTKMVDGFEAIGGSGLVAFADVGVNKAGGYWGMLDNIYEDGSARYDALLAAVKENAGSIVGGIKDAIDDVISGLPVGSAPQAGGSAPVVTPPVTKPTTPVTTTPERVAPVSVDDDYNGDGKSDVIFQHVGGNIRGWSATGDSFKANTLADNAKTWKLIETIDMDGDKKADLLMQNTDGQMAIWRSAGKLNTVKDYYTNNTVADRKVAAVGDFNGDGKDDILWKKGDGSLAMWTSTGTDFTKDNWTHKALAAGGKVAGTGDFNGDGRDDLLIQDAAGKVATWIAKAGGGFTENTAFVSPGAGWTVEGVGDFTADGVDDVLWANEAGAMVVWKALKGSFVGMAQTSAGLGQEWHVAQVGDFTGDGRADILMRDDTGSFDVLAGTANGFDLMPKHGGTLANSYRVASELNLFD